MEEFDAYYLPRFGDAYYLARQNMKCFKSEDLYLESSGDSPAISKVQIVYTTCLQMGLPDCASVEETTKFLSNPHLWVNVGYTGR